MRFRGRSTPNGQGDNLDNPDALAMRQCQPVACGNLLMGAIDAAAIEPDMASFCLSLGDSARLCKAQIPQ